jgi:SAM-dependent methyltransferase/uncharacterized protein YbaR (Trm112 family)
MKGKLLSVLCCPACRSDLRLVVFQEDSNAVIGADVPRSRDDAVEGLLECACGIAYPIIDGVPRLLESGLSAFPEFLNRYREKVRGEMGCSVFRQRLPCRPRENDYEFIRTSFSMEWEFFDYAVDRTWGWTLGERKRVFLNDVGLREDQLRGKLLLDAGCGNGTLTAALSTFGSEVVGLDLNDGLGKANRNRARYAAGRREEVHFVQGNLFNPPLRHNSFDVIYCSGVIHHMPNARESFKRLVPLVRKCGRVYIWVYGDRSLPVRIFMESGRQLKRFMRLESLLVTCRLMAPFYKVGVELVNALGVMKFRERSVREITLDLFDLFAPQYNHRQTEEEVQGWFKEERFTNITVSGRQKHGFGVYGDKI